MKRPDSLAFIGFGEVGQTLARGFRHAGLARIRAWDIAFVHGTSPQAVAARKIGVDIASSATEAVSGVALVLSAVTAGAAEAAASALAPDTVYADLNSVSPGTKEQVARIVEGTGGRSAAG